MIGVECAFTREIVCEPSELFGAGWPLKPYGYFSNAKLGRFLAFVTDWQKMVLIVLPDKRLLVSPENPKIILDRFAV